MVLKAFIAIILILPVIGSPFEDADDCRRFESKKQPYQLLRSRNTSSSDEPAAAAAQLKFLSVAGSATVVKAVTLPLTASTAKAIRVLAIDNCRPDVSGQSVAKAAAAAGCEVAINANLFNPESLECKGNVVSDGKIVNDANGVSDANFGVTQNGHWFFGYLSQKQLHSMRFKELVGGLVWLVRNGTNSVLRSTRAECSSTQTTGSMSDFASVRSARSAIAALRSGELLLVQVDGKTRLAGLDLYDLADLLVDLGAVSAVNLDGGSSSTLVFNGTVVSDATADCSSSRNWQQHERCFKRVPAVVCIMPRRQQQQQHHQQPKAECCCLNGGKCSSSSSSSSRQQCTCTPGWTGRLCERHCPPGYYGDDCNRVCDCTGSCNPINGSCAQPFDKNAKMSLLTVVRLKLQAISISKLNAAVIALTAALTISVLCNCCLCVQWCKLRCAAGRRGGGAAAAAAAAVAAAASGSGRRSAKYRVLNENLLSDSDSDNVKL